MAPLQRVSIPKDSNKNCGSLMGVTDTELRAVKKYADCDKKRTTPCRDLNEIHPNKLQ